jgi:hypothetical protein
VSIYPVLELRLLSSSPGQKYLNEAMSIQGIADGQDPEVGGGRLSENTLVKRNVVLVGRGGFMYRYS